MSSPNSADEIIPAVLQACRGDALKISEILLVDDIVPLVEQHGEARVRSVVHSLATVGWLHMRGRTNSAYYQTTALGVYSLGKKQEKGIPS